MSQKFPLRFTFFAEKQANCIAWNLYRKVCLQQEKIKEVSKKLCWLVFQRKHEIRQEVRKSQHCKRRYAVLHFSHRCRRTHRGCLCLNFQGTHCFNSKLVINSYSLKISCRSQRTDYLIFYLIYTSILTHCFLRMVKKEVSLSNSLLEYIALKRPEETSPKAIMKEVKFCDEKKRATEEFIKQ